MEAMKPSLYRTASVSSTQSDETLTENLSLSTPSSKDLLKFKESVKDIKNEEKAANAKSPKMGTRKQKLLDKMTKFNSLTAKEKTRFLLTGKASKNRGPHDFIAPKGYHTSRKYAEVPLTAEGVDTLQHDRRINRKAGAKIGVQVGGGVGLMLGLCFAPIAAGTGGPLAPALILAPAAFGAALGAAKGIAHGKAEGVRPDTIRTHGLYYTGIVESKKLSRKITLEVLGSDAKRSSEPGTISNELKNWLSGNTWNLSEKQIADIEAYYQFAFEAATKDQDA